MAKAKKMNKGIKITGIVVLSIVAFIMAAAFILPYVISLDKYKGIIEEKMEQALKRDVSLGKLRLSILPTLGAKIENLVISNPPGFSQTPLLSLQSAKVRIKIIPLLFGKKEIAGTLNRPVIFIEKDPQRRLNIPGMEAAGKGERKGKLESGTIKTDQSKALQLMGFTLSHFSLQGGKFIYLDRSTQPSRRSEIEEVDLDIWDLALDKKIRYKLSLHWSPGEVSFAGWVGPLGNSDFKKIPLEGKLKADFPKLDGLMKKLAGMQEGTMQGVLKADVNFSGNTGSSLKVKGDVSLKDLALGEKGARSIEGLDITLRPEAELTGGGEQLQLSAALQLDRTPFQIKGQFSDLSKHAAGKLTLTAPQGINLAEIGPKFPALDRAAKLKGQLAVSGELSIPAKGSPLFSLDANSARVDITLPEQKKGADKKALPQKNPSGEKKSVQKGGMEARSKVTIKEGKFQDVDYHNFLLTAEMKNGTVRITRLTCQAFSGTVEGDGTFNLTQEPSPFTMKTKITGVDINALLTSFASSSKGMVKGRFNGDATLSGAGFSMDTLKENLTGTGTVLIKEGELTWLNLINRVVQAAGGKGGGKEKTTFDDLTTAFTVKNGMVNMPNLLIKQKDVDLKLQGNIGLDSKLKMDGEAHLPQSATGDLSNKGWKFFTDQKGRLTIPFNLTGNLSDPKVGISMKFIEQGVKGVLQELLQKKKKK
jgi:AsmA protein